MLVLIQSWWHPCQPPLLTQVKCRSTAGRAHTQKGRYEGVEKCTEGTDEKTAGTSAPALALHSRIRDEVDLYEQRNVHRKRRLHGQCERQLNRHIGQDCAVGDLDARAIRNASGDSPSGQDEDQRDVIGRVEDEGIGLIRGVSITDPVVCWQVNVLHGVGQIQPAAEVGVDAPILFTES